MIRTGVLDRLRLRARCYGLRVATVDRIERERDDAVRERDLMRVTNERLSVRAARAEGPVADHTAMGVAAELGALLHSLGHAVTGDLERDFDRAIDVERERRGQDHVAVARALGLADPATMAFELPTVLGYVRGALLWRERYEAMRAALADRAVAPAAVTDGEAIEQLATLVRAAGARYCGACGSVTDPMMAGARR